MMKENYLKSELYDLMRRDSRIFEFIQSGSLDGIWYWDLENPQNEWMSPKFWQTLGYDPDEKKHQANEWQDIIFQEDLKLATENFDKHCIDPNYPYDQIVRYKHKNGSTVWVRCRGLAIRDESGKAIRMLGAHVDITDLKETEKEMTRLTKEYEKVFNGTQDSMFLIKVLDNGNFMYIRNNLAHQNKTGILLDHIMNKTPQELLGKEMGDIVSANYQKCVDARKSITYEEELNLPGGNYIWSTTLTPIIEENLVSYIVGSAMDITERKKMELELQQYANYDQLTGLPNRRLFFERLKQLIIESKREKNQFALLFIDLDDFKGINDQYGHHVGDEVLINVGNRLLNCLRKSDTVARMGGDEFTILLRNVNNKESVHSLIKKIHKTLKKTIYLNSIECNINASIGVSIYPENGESSEGLLKYADSSMYAMKRKEPLC
jgi:diguanylate cyclase (GGDEF)-like protein/PAS domain S-box-containing protein